MAILALAVSAAPAYPNRSRELAGAYASTGTEASIGRRGCGGMTIDLPTVTVQGVIDVIRSQPPDAWCARLDRAGTFVAGLLVERPPAAATR
jgi:hypothetical protein